MPICLKLQAALEFFRGTVVLPDVSRGVTAKFNSTTVNHPFGIHFFKEIFPPPPRKIKKNNGNIAI